MHVTAFSFWKQKGFTTTNKERMVLNDIYN